MSYINHVTIVGNLTADPQAGNVRNGTAANMRVASDLRFTDAEGKEAERVDYIDVDAYGKLGENCILDLKKGDRVIIAGPLRYDTWQDDDGGKHSKHRVKAKAVGKSLEF